MSSVWICRIEFIRDIRKIIDYLLNISEQEWKNEKKKYLDIIMPYDEDNKIFKKYISEEGLLADK